MFFHYSPCAEPWVKRLKASLSILKASTQESCCGLFRHGWRGTNKESHIRVSRSDLVYLLRPRELAPYRGFLQIQSPAFLCSSSQQTKWTFHCLVIVWSSAFEMGAGVRTVECRAPGKEWLQRSYARGSEISGTKKIRLASGVDP